MTSVDQCWSYERTAPANFTALIPPGVRKSTRLTDSTDQCLSLEQWVWRARGRMSELKMLEDSESRNVRDNREREQWRRAMLDSHRRWNRRLRIDMRHLLDAASLRARDESVTDDIVANLGGAKV